MNEQKNGLTARKHLDFVAGVKCILSGTYSFTVQLK